MLFLLLLSSSFFMVSAFCHDFALGFYAVQIKLSYRRMEMFSNLGVNHFEVLKLINEEKKAFPNFLVRVFRHQTGTEKRIRFIEHRLKLNSGGTNPTIKSREKEMKNFTPSHSNSSFHASHLFLSTLSINAESEANGKKRFYQFLLPPLFALLPSQRRCRCRCCYTRHGLSPYFPVKLIDDIHFSKWYN